MARKAQAKKPTPQKPLRVFISYSNLDKDLVWKIADRLRNDGHTVWMDTLNLHPGDNIAESIKKGLAQAEAIIFVISQNSLKSDWVRREFSFIALQQLSRQQQRIIPIRLDESEVPSYIADRVYIDFSSDFARGLAVLTETLKVDSVQSLEAENSELITQEPQDSHIQTLNNCLRRGRLTLFCGAGTSVGAGIPTWHKLLARLLETMIDRISENQDLALGSRAALDFQDRSTASSLILGKYLKNNLGRDFPKAVREALYESSPTTCGLIDSIVSLSRPQRDGRPLDSIITFNFDSLIEEQLLVASVANKAIFSESVYHDPNEMPVYHVHGYLPRDGDIPKDTDLVFSEDAYHSQFIDPFSWSNLMQLNKLTQNACLFVGISLTDPNMRRLLDVAWRKNSRQRLRHYIVKRLPETSEGDSMGKLIRLLEEQDANALGLNVIWIREYHEIPTLLEEIANPSIGVRSTEL